MPQGSSSSITAYHGTLRGDCVIDTGIISCPETRGCAYTKLDCVGNDIYVNHLLLRWLVKKKSFVDDVRRDTEFRHSGQGLALHNDLRSDEKRLHVFFYTEADIHRAWLHTTPGMGQTAILPCVLEVELPHYLVQPTLDYELRSPDSADLPPTCIKIQHGLPLDRNLKRVHCREGDADMLEGLLAQKGYRVPVVRYEREPQTVGEMR